MNLHTLTEVCQRHNGGYGLNNEAKEKIETAWNKAGTEMRYVKRVG